MVERIVGIALVALAVGLGAFKPNLFELDGPRRIRKALLVLAAAFGVALALGILRVPRTAESPIAWRTDVETALAEARAAGRPAILDAGAAWCDACKELERKTFSDTEVVAALAAFVPIHVDMTDFDPAQERLARIGIDVPALPLVAFFLPDGRQNPGSTLTDFEGPHDFARRVRDAGVFRDRPKSPVEAWLGDRGLIVALLLVFAAGVGVSLTPCVFPMIPITLAVISRTTPVGPGGQSGDRPLRQRAIRAAAFVGGMVVTYTALGVAAAMLGMGFGSWLQHPAVTLTMAALFAVLAVSYLKFFTLDLPTSIKARLGRRRDGRGGLVELAMIGGATGIIAAPCAGPVVVGILALIGGTGDLVLGASLMLAFALGLGLLFFVLGVSTALFALRPRGGAWMERVEIGFAVALMVVAIHYASLGLA